ncbi:hypothetical protein AwDysgo_19110 [Bacteroidales bacterium]|nr:hypothetical protein AwDysgo_19110 [Bacteroidales bacterium]
MLKKVLSISGKPGLFKLISQGKNMYIAESLVDNKKIPVYPRDKVVSLGDIAIYSQTEEVPLQEVLLLIKKKEEGKLIEVNTGIQNDELRDYFSKVLTDFDKDRVYPSDIRKIITWYNILTKADHDFETVEGENAEDSVDADAKAVEVGADLPKKTAKASKPSKDAESSSAKTSTPKAKAKVKKEGA